MSAYDPIIRVAVLIGYLAGSIPFGLLFTWAAGLGDVRAIGSGNIGATNVLRTGNKPLAAATLLADVLKGTVVILVMRYTWGEGAAIAAGIGAFIGHIFPVWLRFKGGKGVATYIGVQLGLYWPAAIAFCLIWLATAWLFRISSLAALTAATLTPIGVLALSVTLAAGGEAPSSAPQVSLGVVLVVLSAFVFFTHRANIARLIAGTESRISLGKKPAATESTKPAEPTDPE
ncbi:MAG: glycerol-3-phosphate 1-O-acyltransferase PlsY [Ancalomicrobiaceae bacterium]|nr:glycerol-3-phosphate 1-O-acyltransferase PlsY [Ancalomicrobiaceae bacterium]